MPRKPKIEATVTAGPVTNRTKGVTVHLGDGRRLSFGDSAVVGAEMAALLRSKGLCE